jgi:hypothetical protein
MPLLTWQLWLARAACIDSPLPWQSTQDTLSPGRVAQAFPLILAAIGTPAQPPKTRGKSPGRAQGHQPPPDSCLFLSRSCLVSQWDFGNKTRSLRKS